MLQISPRQLRIFMAVAESGSISSACNSIPRVQSSLTHSIQKLEHSLGAKLYERSSSGMKVTEFGRVVHEHAVRIFNELNALKLNFSEKFPDLKINQRAPFFELSVSAKRLHILHDLLQHRHMGQVAKIHQVSQPAVSIALKEFEDDFRCKLFERHSNNLVLTKFGEILKNGLHKIYNHLIQIQIDVRRIKNGEVGNLKIGTLSLGRTPLLAQAIVATKNNFPNISISTTEGSYEHLVDLLNTEDIDFIIGGIRSSSKHPDLVSTTLYSSKLQILCSREHPLCSFKEDISWKDLHHQEWVLPPQNTWTRSSINELMQIKNMPMPYVSLETVDPTLTIDVISNSNLITAASTLLYRREIEAGIVAPLLIDTSAIEHDVGATEYKNRPRSTSADYFLNFLFNLSFNIRE